MRRSFAGFRRALALLACAACAAGGGFDRAREVAAGSGPCRVTLPPGAPVSPDAAPSPPFAAPPSMLVVSVEVPLAIVRGSLEARIPRRVAEEHDQDIGVAGRLEYTVDRGVLAVSVEGDALLIEATLEAHAMACAKGHPRWLSTDRLA